MIILINIFALLFIFFIAYWFWFNKANKRSIKITDFIEIKVKDGVYQPAIMNAKIGQPITLRFIRTDPTPCAEVVIFNQLNISKQLPINIPTDIIIKPTKLGELEFTCQMGMYRGKIIII